MQGLKLAGIELDRKVLAELAVNEPAAFAALVEVARAALPRAEAHGRSLTSTERRRLTRARLSPSARPRVAAARRADPARRRASTPGAFLAEGPQAGARGAGLGRQAPRALGRVHELFGTADARRPPRRAARPAAGTRRAGRPGHRQGAAASLSETVTPQGLVAVCALRRRARPTRPGRRRRGWPRRSPSSPTPATPARCCAPRTPPAPARSSSPGRRRPVQRQVRARSAGSLFHLDVVRGAAAEPVVAALRAAGLTRAGRRRRGRGGLDDAADDGARRAGRVAVRQRGARPARRVAALADARVRIPMRGRAESLNLAAAAAICLYATARAQRGRGRGWDRLRSRRDDAGCSGRQLGCGGRRWRHGVHPTKRCASGAPGSEAVDDLATGDPTRTTSAAVDRRGGP